jgi:hypothetical protein
MRKFLVFVFLVLASIPAMAQTGSVTDWCNQGATPAKVSGLNSTNSLQGIVPKCTVTVYLTGTTTLATIFADSNNTPLTNPFTASTIGQWLFYASTSSCYDVTLSGGLPPNTYPAPVTRTGLCGEALAGPAITLTTDGTSGPSTFSGGILNIPVYSSFTAQSASTFFVGPCGGAASIPTFRVFCSADSAAALAADPTFTWNVATLNSATINNTGTIFTQNLITSEDLAYHTDCSQAGNNSFAFGLISNGTFGGPLLAEVVTSGICPVQSDYTIGGWATDTLSVQNGGGLIFSNCGANASCPGSSPALSQQVLFTPTEPTGPCPNIPAPGPSNLPIWNFSADGHVAFCTNQAGSSWVNKI